MQIEGVEEAVTCLPEAYRTWTVVGSVLVPPVPDTPTKIDLHACLGAFTRLEVLRVSTGPWRVPESRIMCHRGLLVGDGYSCEECERRMARSLGGCCTAAVS